ncbi:MAG: SDR family oxidoreductase [Cryomorphaceae bacterium]|nr:SDR family oxidoreductase [Cryomorphaceae bacterium]
MANILIIGGSSGIGLELATQLSSNGNHVFTSFNKNDQPSKNNLTYFRHDALEEPNMDLLPEVIDGLVYCPGTISLRPFARIDSVAFLNDFNLQVGGAIRWIQAALPRLKKSEQASILLFSTVAVSTGLNFHSLVASSKGAIEGLTRSLAAELAPKIRVNCLAPSLTDTPLAEGLLNSPEKRDANAQRHPLKRIGTPADLANAAKFLLSDQAGWITGQVLHVDGGLSNLKI